MTFILAECPSNSKSNCIRQHQSRMEGRKRSSSTSSHGSSHECRKKGYEKAVELSRRVVQHGTAFVDNRDAISEILAAQASAKAFCLTATYACGEESLGEDVEYYGQAGLLCGDRLTPSPEADARHAKRHKPSVSFAPRGRFEATPITAKHMLENEGDETFKMARIASPHIRGLVNLFFPEAGFVPRASDAVEIRPAVGESEALVWNMRDVTKGRKISDSRSQLTERRLLYEMVSDDFQLRVGQQIGIAIYRTFDIDFEDAQLRVGDIDDLEKLYGRKNSISILTGEISFVSADSRTIEHTINTFSGCSGAVIFLLDRNQEESCHPHYFGKAVAVHVGADVDLPRNVGFAL